MTGLDEILATLATRRRRFALYCLREEGVVELDDLARRVCAWESGVPPEAVQRDALRRVRVDLHHRHLRLFIDASCIEYDEQSRVVRYRDPPEPLPELLDVVCQFERPELRR